MGMNKTLVIQETITAALICTQQLEKQCGRRDCEPMASFACTGLFCFETTSLLVSLTDEEQEIESFDQQVASNVVPENAFQVLESALVRISSDHVWLCLVCLCSLDFCFQVHHRLQQHTRDDSLHLVRYSHRLILNHHLQLLL